MSSKKVNLYQYCIKVFVNEKRKSIFNIKIVIKIIKYKNIYLILIVLKIQIDLEVKLIKIIELKSFI